jgi:hypothetical protein
VEINLREALRKSGVDDRRSEKLEERAVIPDPPVRVVNDILA